ncbi:MAG: UPF0164 family protein, partial [Spirochaetaceae bacterium]|nr:UPF0164 family protein [Spirochaetaceae bacterium]
NISYNLFSDYYYDGFSIGANVKTAYRSISQSLAENQNALGLMGDLGIISRFNFLKFYASRDKNLALGLSLKNLGAEFIENPDPLPSSATAGLAYSPIRPLTVAADVNLPFYLNGEDAEQLSYAFGMDFTATSFLSMQTGFLLKAGKPRITMGSTMSINDFTLYANYTLDLTTQFQPVDRISVSLKIDLGDKGRTTIRDKVQEIYLLGLESYAQGLYLQAINHWEDCLELDPEFIPAQEMIETTKKSNLKKNKDKQQLKQHHNGK